MEEGIQQVGDLLSEEHCELNETLWRLPTRKRFRHRHRLGLRHSAVDLRTRSPRTLLTSKNLQAVEGETHKLEIRQEAAGMCPAVLLR